MFRAVARIFRTPDLRKKIALHARDHRDLPPRLVHPRAVRDFQNVQTCLQANSNTSGASTSSSTCSAAARCSSSRSSRSGIMPYITASIIVQLLRVVIPHFETLYKEGQSGQATLTQYTRYLTIALGVLQSTTLITVARSGALFGTSGSALRSASELITDADPWYAILLMVITMTAGTGLIMWMGELDHRARHRQRNVAPHLHVDRGSLPELARHPSPPRRASRPSSSSSRSAWYRVLGLVVFVEQSQRRIPVQYAKRMVGRRTYGGNNTYIPIKVNMAGVVPGHLRLVAAVPAALIAQFNQPKSGDRQGGLRALGALDHRLPHQGRQPALHGALLPAHRRLHLLLRRDHLQPGRGRRQHEEVRRIHPRHPCRAPDGRVPRLRADPRDAARARSTWASSP